MTVHTGSPAPLVDAMLQPLAQNWWVLLLRGIAAIIFGILAFVLPGLTLLTLTVVWGAFAFVDGALALWAAITGRGGRVTPRWWLAVVGLAGVAIGVLAVLNPVAVAGALLLYIAVWAIVVGVLEIWGGIRLRKEIQGEWLLILTGVLWVLFGIAMIARPGVGALAVIWMIGAAAIVAGISFVGFAFRLKKHKLPA
ncbi:HdeD family acid-resistance protein [Caulobacter sp. 17J80-11]|uniref:HdeD family acid-resistance protein n=1 Tax=Caulobacter sp. 17J80-11 TaxID=2763502 RepID=UPI001653E1DE|nr:HdeD family acid-resistance protein [Caulobacter sp. 17J80-11]MBC6982555.1 HdeD family acid-resistance protein [Caulobacter sp. 17J80-11]